jgi:hypothetical protein
MKKIPIFIVDAFTQKPFGKILFLEQCKGLPVTHILMEQHVFYTYAGKQLS